MLVPPPRKEFVENPKCPWCSEGHLVKGVAPGNPLARLYGRCHVAACLIAAVATVVYGLLQSDRGETITIVALACLPLFGAYMGKMIYIENTTIHTCSHCKRQK